MFPVYSRELTPDRFYSSGRVPTSSYVNISLRLFFFPCWTTAHWYTATSPGSSTSSCKALSTLKYDVFMIDARHASRTPPLPPTRTGTRTNRLYANSGFEPIDRSPRDWPARTRLFIGAPTRCSSRRLRRHIRCAPLPWRLERARPPAIGLTVASLEVVSARTCAPASIFIDGAQISATTTTSSLSIFFAIVLSLFIRLDFLRQSQEHVNNLYRRIDVKINDQLLNKSLSFLHFFEHLPLLAESFLRNPCRDKPLWSKQYPAPSNTNKDLIYLSLSSTL